VTGDADVAAAAGLLGEPARAALVLALMDRAPLSASELAARAGVAPSTASGHLTRLVRGGLVAVEPRGRHRYFRLAGREVAEAVEALAAIAPRRPVRSLRGAAAAEALRTARTCYDHLAGRLGVELTAALERDRVLVRCGSDYELGRSAPRRLAALEIDLEALARLRRPLVRLCLDWSERRPHVAGALGAALAERLFVLGWIERRAANRSVEVTRAGRAHLADELGVTVHDTR
jgi:DNA-binding transcriptional ArsR family regulator